MGNFSSFQRQKREASVPPPSSFTRPVRSFAPVFLSSLEPVSLDIGAQLEWTRRFGHSLDRISIFPPSRHTSDEGQHTEDVVQQKRPVQDISQASKESVPAEPAQAEKKSRLAWNIAQIPLFPNPTTLPSANIGLPASVGQRLRMRAVDPRPGVQPASPPALHLFATEVVQRRDRTQEQNVPLKKKKTGLPDRLKVGVESLSGLSLDDVNVHYSSSKPAQVQALAYTQGTEIHVGPGQERHLAHEAWHVVQQKQGRVKPTLQAKGIPINDDKILEDEANVMGARGMRELKSEEGIPQQTDIHGNWGRAGKSFLSTQSIQYKTSVVQMAKEVKNVSASSIPALPQGIVTQCEQLEQVAKTGNATQRKASRQRILDLMYQQLEQDGLKGLPDEYRSKIPLWYADGDTSFLGIYEPESSRMRISSLAFERGLPVVYSTLRHEVIHIAQRHETLETAKEQKLDTDVASRTYRTETTYQNAATYISEIETHTWELIKYKETGVSDEHVVDTAKKLCSYLAYVDHILKLKTTSKLQKVWIEEQLAKLKNDIAAAKNVYKEVTKKEFDSIVVTIPQ